MVDARWKPIVFTATVIVAIVLISLLLVHRSSNRVCKNSVDLLYISNPINQNETMNSTCYPLNEQGPCGDKMILIQDVRNQSLGVCDCDNINNQRTLVYDDDRNQCYFIFTQAYCGPGQWLNFTNKGSICEDNFCKYQPGSLSEWVPLKDGSCVELGKPHHSCNNESNEVMRFFRNKLYPACNYRPELPAKINIGNVGVPPADCPEKHSRTRLGHCALDFDFD